MKGIIDIGGRTPSGKELVLECQVGYFLSQLVQVMPTGDQSETRRNSRDKIYINLADRKKAVKDDGHAYIPQFCLVRY